MKTAMTAMVEAKQKAKDKGESPCEWALACENQATHTHPHPILGEVPTCDRCEQLTQ